MIELIECMRHVLRCKVAVCTLQNGDLVACEFLLFWGAQQLWQLVWDVKFPRDVSRCEGWRMRMQRRWLQAQPEAALWM